MFIRLYYYLRRSPLRARGCALWQVLHLQLHILPSGYYNSDLFAPIYRLLCFLWFTLCKTLLNML